MRHWRLMVGILVLGFLLSAAPGVVAPHALPDRSTRMTDHGMYQDLEIDPARGRLYASDAQSFDGVKPVGVAVFDLDSHGEVSRISLSNPTGLALSPSGATLVVGTGDGYIHVIDPGTLEVTQSAFFYGEGQTAAVMWDVAFHGEDRLIVSLGSVFITCEGMVLVINLATLSEETRLSEPPCGVRPWSRVLIDPGRNRLYLLASGLVSVYDLAGAAPSKITAREHGGFTGRGALTPDGGRLIFSSGSVYDALTLDLLADGGRTGDVALDPTGAHAYFARAPFVDEVRMSDYTLVARYAFDGVDVPGPSTVAGTVVDAARRVVYVTVPTAGNANRLHAVPLSPAILDPFPGDGWVLSWNDFGVAAVLSGGVEPASVAMNVDGAAVAALFDAERSKIGYLPPSLWPEGTHRVVVTGRDASGSEHRLEWSFTIDTRPPEIVIDTPDAVYRVPEATVTGRIVDATFRDATANYEPLPVDSASGAFSVTLPLEQGGNLLVIEARDWAFNRNVSATRILYVPPTTRYQDADASFSVEYPANWSLAQDVVVEGVPLEAVMSEGSGASMNVVTLELPAGATEADIGAGAEEAFMAVSNLPYFGPVESPRPFEIPGLIAYTYAYEWRPQTDRIFQRQVLVADTTAGRGWLLTFTSPYSGLLRYDPLFQWMASSFRTSAGPAAPGPDLSVLYVFAGALAGAAAAVGFSLYLIRRNRARAALSRPGPMPALPLAETVRFCPSCGAPAVSPCRFCGRCGRSLASGPSDTPKPREPPKSS